MALTLSQSKYSRFNSLNYNQLFQNPYQYTPGKLSEETRSNFISAYESTRTPKTIAPVNDKRSILDRTLDGLQVFNYTLAGGINNLIDDDPETGFWRGVGDGLRASNPFGKGYEPGEVTFSKVLDTAGWQPESGLGKFARGVVGFGLDVVLDPTTYLGGVGLLVKGTGKVGATAKAIDGLAKQYNVPTSMLNASGKLDKMTPEVAEYILKNSERAEGLSKLSKADYDGTIDAFTRNYNRALGLRETGEITIGLRNVPFGDAIVDKVLGKDKLGGIRLAESNKGLMTIGKYSGASHIYGVTRNFLVGRKVIQKLSNTARYNALAKINPIHLFDELTFLRSTKGQQKSIRKAKQDAIRKASAMAKLTPAQQNAIIDLLHDPSNWNLVNKVMDEADVKTYSELQASMSKDLEELVARRQTLEDTYESVVSDLTMKMNTHRDDIARQLRERGEISATLREKQYEIDWINAERERKLAQLHEDKQTKVFDNLDKIRDERNRINAEYESEMTRLVNEQMDINNTLEDTINELARERAMESSRGGFEIIQANKELVDYELEILGRQFAEKQSQIEKAINNKEISFEQAQMARMELSAQLEAEAKRIYNRKYYQIKKIKPTTYDIAEQEKALAEAMQSLEELKAKGVGNYSAEEAKQLDATIAELKNERSRLLSEKAELTQHERVEKQLQNAINSEKALSSYIDKSFSVDTQFDGMEFSQIKDTISDQYKLVVTEALMNKIEKSASEAELFKLYKSGLDTENPYDVIAESIEFEEMNALRGMLSELIVGSKSYLHLHGSDALKVSEFIMLDVNDKDSLVEFFINSGNLFLNTAKKEMKQANVWWHNSNKGQLDNLSAEYLAHITQTVGQIPMLRELLSENYGRLSGLDGKFYRHMGKRLGYKDFFRDVYVKMNDLFNKKESMETTYENAMAELGSIDVLSDTAETVLKRISQQNSFDYKKLLDDMKVSKPTIQHPSQRVAIDNLTRKIEEQTMGIIDGSVRADAQALVKSVQDIYNTDFANATDILSDTVKLARDGDLNASNQLEDIVRQQYNGELSDLFAKHEDHILEKEALKDFEQRTYNFENADEINAFADDLSDAVMNQLPDYAKTVNEIDRLIAIREVRMEEMDYFLKLNHVEKTEYLRLLNEDASLNNFIQGSLSREFDRAKQARIQQMSTNRDGTGRRIEDYETEANLGIINKFDYNTIAEDAKEDISKLFFKKHTTRTFNELPRGLKARIDSLSEIASNAYTPTPRSTVSQRTLVSNDAESISVFASNAIRGRLTSIDVEGLYKKIDEQFAEKGKGMDKRKKEYRELKKKAEDMKRAVDYKAHILKTLNEKSSRVGGTLEVSSRGDKRFSALYAKINFGGSTQSIEDIYQGAKRFEGEQLSWKKAKGKTPSSVTINGKELAPKYLSQFYDLLWLKYFSQNPDLLHYARKFDDYNDMFKGKSINTQEKTIRRISNEGMQKVFNDSSELVEILKDSPDIQELKRLIETRFANDFGKKPYNPVEKNLFNLLGIENSFKYIESFGLASLERIDSVKSELFSLAERESRSGKISKTRVIMRELNKRITESKQSLDDMSKFVNDPKMKDAVEDVILQQEELLLLKELLNFGVKLDDRSLLSIFGSALSNVKSKHYGSKKEIGIILGENAGYTYSIRNSDMNITKTIEGLQMLIPHLIQGRYPGQLFSDLKPGQQFKLVEEGFGILKKEFDGEPPSDVTEMLEVLGEKSLDEVRTRNLTKSYDKFISSASENTYVTFLDENGEAIIGRLSNADELPAKFANNVKLKVDVLSREVGNSRNTVEVPFSNVIKTDEDALRPIFNSYDSTVERQLIETRNKVEEFKNELAERIAREEEVLPELQDQINHITKEIDDLFAKRTGLTREYHTKLGEMEALVQSLRSGIEAKKATGLDIEGTVKSLEVQYLAKKEASWIARFDEADPFATAVPGTKEWDDLMEEIIERDEDLKALLPEYEKAQETLMKWADIEEMWKAQKQHYNTDEGYAVYLDNALEEGVDEADLLSKTAYKASKKDLYTRDVNPEKVRQAKELAKQFEGLLKQKALGFQKGDGFILFREKTDLLAEWATVRDELQIKFDELEVKKSELKQRETDFNREARNSKARQKRKEAKIEKLEAKDTAIEGEQFLFKARIEDEIAQLDKEVDKLQKRDAKLGREYDKYNKQINETINTINEEVAILQRQHALIAKEAQESVAERMPIINNANASAETLKAEIQKVNDEILRLEEALESNEALDAYLRMDLGEDLAEAIKRKSKGLPAYKFAIEDNANIADNLKRFAVDFKREMIRMGREEVSIGKLGEKQFEAMINRYFPRVLSADGERFFAKKRELLEHIRPLTADYGFNTKFNNHAIGRVEELRELGIKEVNDFFEQHPEYGVRIFEENLARAYVGRAIKHAELMYDDEYTKIIMDVVGYQPVIKTQGTSDLKSSNTRENLLRERKELERKVELLNKTTYKNEERTIVPGKEAVRTVLFENLKKRDLTLIAKHKDVIIKKSLPKDHLTSDIDEVQRAFSPIIRAINNGDLELVSTKLNEFLTKYNVDIKEIIPQLKKPTVVEELGQDEIKKTFVHKVDNRDLIDKMKARIVDIDSELTASRSYVEAGKTVFEVKDGYELVANFGHIRQYIRELVDMQVQIARKNLPKGQSVTDEMIGRFEKEVIESLSIDPKILDEYKMPMVKLEGEALEKLNSVGLVRQMSKQIVEEANSARMLQIQRDNSRMLQIYDKFTIWLKAMQTAVMPAFHIRNFQGNLFQNWLAVGAEAFNPKTIKQTFEVSRRIQDRDWLAQLDPIEFVDKNGSGQAIHWTKIVDEAIVHGVINEGFFAKDFDGYAKSSGLLGGGKWDFTSTDNFLPIKKGFEVGTIIENQGRLAQFTALLKQGYDFEEAAEIVTKYLFDYSDLTHFEKKWMKRIFPYYTWMRKNSVLQVRELIDQPNKYAQVGKLGQSMENSADPNNEIEDKYISNYARDWTLMPFTMKNKDGVEEPVLFSSNLPFKDLAGMPFDPFNIVDSMRNLIAQTSPVFKKPAELLFNYNIHYDSPIVSEHSGNPFTPRINHVLTELAWYNAVQGFMNQDTAGDKFLSGLNTFGGIKMSSYDYEANKRRTVENAWEDYYGKFFGATLNSAQMRVTDAMTWKVKSTLSSSIVKLAGLPPQAGEYSGALAPISEETYNSLSDEEKQKYTKPTNSEMGYINKRAQELSEQTYNESGKFKKFGWMMLDTIDVPYKNPIHAVRVSEVVDGDTLKISFGGGTESVRLLLVDTPESKGEYEDNPMAFGKEAYEFSKQMVLGKDVKLYLDGIDSYGRMLAFVEQDDSVLNEELLREGLGKVRYLYERGDKNYDVQRFREVESEAYQQGRGVWSIPGYATPGDTDFEGGRSSR